MHTHNEDMRTLERDESPKIMPSVKTIPGDVESYSIHTDHTEKLISTN